MTTILVTRFCQNAALAFPLQLRAVEKTLLTRAALENNMGLRSASMSTTPVSSERPSVDSSNLRRIKDLPGPKAYPFVGSMFSLRAAFTDIVPMFTARAKQYYPMYREKILGQNIVVLSGSELIETFFRHEEKYPNRFDMPMWMEYREKSGEAYGVFTGRAEQWHRMRTVVDKPMMRMKDVSAYTEEVNEVVTDFLDRLGKIRDEGRVAPDLEGELFNWSLESIGSILYEHRFGGLSDDRDPEMEEFIRSVHVMLQTSTELFMYPVWLTKIFRNKDYKAHARAWDTLFRIAKKCVDARVTEIAAQRERGDEAQGVLPYLLAQKSLSEKEIYANVTELMMAAVDTTSNTTLWAMYELSQHPHMQERLSAEVERVLPDGRIPSFRDLQDLPYLRALVKETLRLYPAAGSVARIISEDMELGGYFLPKKTAVTVPLYAVGRLEQHFEEPLTFDPERWLKDRKDRPNPYSSLPFGVGVRSCVGRRVAELELHVLLARLIQRFRVEAAFTDTPLISMRLVLRPDRPLRFRLIDRR